jgi:hypothetical protein
LTASILLDRVCCQCRRSSRSLRLDPATGSRIGQLGGEHPLRPRSASRPVPDQWLSWPHLMTLDTAKAQEARPFNNAWTAARSKPSHDRRLATCRPVDFALWREITNKAAGSAALARDIGCKRAGAGDMGRNESRQALQQCRVRQRLQGLVQGSRASSLQLPRPAQDRRCSCS